ncbi:NAD(P)/FAD-dependent oxidoreductase [Candidatus Woesearchaeota archaeon]|nr:NAD(P)/FAD-dependent oxidoreductase [Candidatus Woesearchaeota archaeon]
MKEYDIIIVGIGPAGMGAASSLIKSKLKVCLIDSGITINPVLVTAKKTIEKFKLKKAVIQNYNKFSLYSKNYGFSKRFPKGLEWVAVDVKKAKDIMKKKLDFDLVDDTEIIEAKRQGRKIVLTDFRGNKYRAKIVIDASGNAAVIAKSLGLKTKSKAYFFCYAVELENCNIKDPYEFSWDVNPDYTNGAFNMYPYSKKKGQFVIADFEPYTLASEEDLKRRLLLAIKKERPYNNYFKNARIIKDSEFSAVFPLQAIPRMVDDNLLVVGSSAGQVTPSIGEGFRPGIELGYIAGEIAEKAVEENNVSEERLKEFEEIWKKTYGKNQFLMKMVRHIGSYFNNEEHDLALKAMQRLNINEFLKYFTSEMGLGIFFKCLSFKLLFVWLRNRILFFNNQNEKR